MGRIVRSESKKVKIFNKKEAVLKDKIVFKPCFNSVVGKIKQDQQNTFETASGFAQCLNGGVIIFSFNWILPFFACKLPFSFHKPSFFSHTLSWLLHIFSEKVLSFPFLFQKFPFFSQTPSF